ncbi:hypothetical protein DAI22_12g062300 [Oryza sativa Japonica Group]|nr:hypothetical protein DAI22_12g062300 [Oryza sativa Japonica Group]KAF2906992.1 hypothetical protein DAI22_12g062300 [Oryza sativa Japonica Group]
MQLPRTDRGRRRRRHLAQSLPHSCLAFHGHCTCDRRLGEEEREEGSGGGMHRPTTGRAMARRCGSGGGRPSESELPRQPPVGGIDTEVVALTLHSIVSTWMDLMRLSRTWIEQRAS